MKKMLLIIAVLPMVSCAAQIKLSDASLKIDTVDLVSACDCNHAFLLNMEEDVAILTEVKRINKKGSQMSWLDEEYKKRLDKHWQFFTRCKAIYKEQGSGSNCENFKKGEELDKKLNALLKELGME
jgi:hypothetical protein